jgi:outer membrane lipoprotein-sorting protein
VVLRETNASVWALLRTVLGGLMLLWAVEVRAATDGEAAAKAAAIIARMTAAYARVPAYQTETETSEYRKGRLVETRRFRYFFKKPYQLRIDMETPHPGMRLIYPDENGKVFIRFGGWRGFMPLRLAPDNVLFATRSGQRIDQSDFGLLIRNIGRSLSGQRRGELQVMERDRQLLLEVMAVDHFLPGVVTRFRFVIDTTLWLPVAVEELTEEGQLKRTIHFRHLKTDPAFSQQFFHIDEKDSAHGQ